MPSEEVYEPNPSRSARRLAALEDIAQVEMAIGDLRRKRLELDEVLNSTLPVMALPAEILVEAFFLAVQKQFDGTYGNGQGRVPFILATVCRSWRKICLETPLPWSLISLRFNLGNVERMNVILEEWLARSGCCPIHIRLERYNVPDLTFLSVLTKVRQESSRLKSFTYNFNIPDRELPLMALEATYPILKTLAIQTNGPGYFRATPSNTWSTFMSAELRTLHLDKISPRCFSLNFKTLVSFTGSLDTQDILYIFQVATSLVDCEITIVSPRHPSSEPLSNALLPQLERLVISGSNTELFKYITAPRLGHLEAKKSGPKRRQVDWHAAYVTEMLERSACQLRELNLDSWDGSPAVREIFKHASSLAVLVLKSDNSSHFDDELLESLKLLPKLSSLSLIGSISFEIETLRDLYSPPPAEQSSNGSNNAGSGTLKYVSVKYNNEEWGHERHPNTLRDFYQDILLAKCQIEFSFLG